MNFFPMETFGVRVALWIQQQLADISLFSSMVGAQFTVTYC